MDPATASATGESIMQQLRAATQLQHDQAEARPLEQSLVRGTLPRTLYAELLAQRWLVHAVLEERVRALCERDERLGSLIPPELYQEANLRRDLEHLGIDSELVRPLAATRRLIDDIEQAARERPLALLGCYYVFEGSKNGGRLIAQSVRQAYGLERDGVRYLDPHGNEQRGLWRRFKQRMDGLPLAAGEQRDIIDMARLTFQRVSEMDDEMYGSSREPQV